MAVGGSSSSHNDRNVELPISTVTLAELYAGAYLMISVAALVHDVTLVTHNTADFRNIPGLRLVDWLMP